MKACLLVAAGGALGAVTRYLIGLIHPKGDFPLTTLLINVLGAVLIGALMGAALNRQMAQEWLLFLKTGVCGGFTTFSTFSLESVALLELSLIHI